MIVFDTSALLALILDEEGADQTKTFLQDSLINSVNYAELAYKLRLLEFDVEQNIAYLVSNGLNLRDFSKAEAEVSATLVTHTKPLGLSLGDRACLATAIHLGLACITADKIWTKLSYPDLKILSIR